MNKIITQKQIESILQIVYSTNCPVSSFDNLSKILHELPESPLTPPEEVKGVTK